MNKRERLARAMWMDTNECGPERWEQVEEITKQCYLGNVDAILAELRELDDRMVAAAEESGACYGNEMIRANWQAMLDAISEDTKPPAPREREKPQYLRYGDGTTIYGLGEPEDM